MEAVRKIVNAGLLANIIDLPWKAKDMRVEIIVMPAGEIDANAADANAVASLKGRLKEYANPILAQKERRAWENSVAEKYGTL
jgi:hypothetical protein